ncbi:uncharacterized protein LOC135815011 isoform X2 [Sycon ciliatum]|uniref:uncharacterized protein LOC135815011 isoform X2 n=1 Tax=Sycon ciliatum TaxID=27933 RepID=UPI0031F66680
MMGLTVDDDYMEMGAARLALDTHKRMVAAAENDKSAAVLGAALGQPAPTSTTTSAGRYTELMTNPDQQGRDRLVSEDEYVDMATLQSTMTAEQRNDLAVVSMACTPGEVPPPCHPAPPSRMLRPDSDYADLDELEKQSKANASYSSSQMMVHFEAADAVPHTLSLPLSPPDSDSSLPRTPSMPNISVLQASEYVDDQSAAMSRSQNALNSFSTQSVRYTGERQFATLDPSFRRRSSRDRPAALLPGMQTPGAEFDSRRQPQDDYTASLASYRYATLDPSFRHSSKHTAFAGLPAAGDGGVSHLIGDSSDSWRSESCLASARPYEAVSNNSSGPSRYTDKLRGQSLSQKSRRIVQVDDSFGPGKLRRDSSDGAIHKIGRGGRNFISFQGSEATSLDSGTDKMKASKDAKTLPHNNHGDEKSPGRLRSRLSTLASKIGPGRSHSPHAASSGKGDSPKLNRKQSLPERGSTLVQAEGFQWHSGRHSSISCPSTNAIGSASGAGNTQGDRADLISVSSLQRSPLGSSTSTSPAPPSPMHVSASQLAKQNASRTVAPPPKPKPYHEYKAVKDQLESLSKDTSV